MSLTGDYIASDGGGRAVATAHAEEAVSRFPSHSVLVLVLVLVRVLPLLRSRLSLWTWA